MTRIIKYIVPTYMKLKNALSIVHHFASRLHKRYPDLLFVSILLFVVLAMLIPNIPLKNQIFMGWDNINPELNLILNIKRSIFSVWQEYQGLGLVAGMG